MLRQNEGGIEKSIHDAQKINIKPAGSNVSSGKCFAARKIGKCWGIADSFRLFDVEMKSVKVLEKVDTQFCHFAHSWINNM